LENRLAPSVSSGFSNGDLKIKGDAQPNQVTIVQNDILDTLRVYSSNVLIGTSTSSRVTPIQASLGPRDDTFSYGLDAGTGNNFSKRADIYLGADDDECHLDFGGGVAGGFKTLYANLDFNVYGGLGGDDLFAEFGAKKGGHLNLFA